MGSLKVVTPPGTGTITVTFGDRKQTIDGFGAALSAYALDSAKADLFFSQSSGIGLSLCRLQFATNSSGPTPYYPESATMATFYNNAALASARGALVWAAPWSAMNTTWKDNGAFIGGHLLLAHFGDFATFVSGLQADMVANGAPTLYGLSVLNEPDFNATAYTSMMMSAADMRDFIKNNLGPSLAALSPRPLLIAPETENWDTAATYVSTISADSTAWGYVDVVATHQYEGTVATLSVGTKKVWQTEMSGIADTFDASMTHGLTVAGWIHSALTMGNVSAWHYFWNVSQNTDNEGLIGNGGSGGTDTTLTKRLYILGNWSKFVRPGWVRIGTTGSVSNVSLTAFEKPSTGEFAIVAINAGPLTSGTIALNGLAVTAVTPWLTSASSDLIQQADVPVTKGVFTCSMAASSVTTFIGTGS